MSRNPNFETVTGRFIPLSGTDIARKIIAENKLLKENEIHTTDDHNRVFFNNYVVAPVWHGNIANEAAMLNLYDNAALNRGCFVGDTCYRVDRKTVWQCINENGIELEDWIEVGRSPVLTTKGDIIVGGVDGVEERYGIGTEDYVLKVKSGLPAWSVSTPITTKGDIIIGDKDGKEARYGIGPEGYVLKSISDYPTWSKSSPLTTLGDLIVGGVDGVEERLGIGDPNHLFAVNDAGDGYEFVNDRVFKGHLIDSELTAFGSDVLFGSFNTTSGEIQEIELGNNLIIDFADKLSVSGVVIYGADIAGGSLETAGASASGFRDGKILGRASDGYGVVESMDVVPPLHVFDDPIDGPRVQLQFSNDYFEAKNDGSPTTDGWYLNLKTVPATRGGTGLTAAAKGTLIVGKDSTTWDDLAVGTDGLPLIAASGETLGLKYSTLGISAITMNTARLLGRYSASTGVVEEIELGTNLSFSGGKLNASGGGGGGITGPSIGTPTTVSRNFSTTGDTNGVLYFIGTLYGSELFSNPYTAGRINLLASSTAAGSIDLIVDRTTNDWYSNDVANSYVAIDLGASKTLVLEDYTVQHYSGPNRYMRTWKVQGTNTVGSWTTGGITGATWTDLDVRSSVTTINSATGVFRFTPNQGVTTAFRYFRLIQTGVESLGANYLCSCTELELYGDFTYTADPIVAGMIATWADDKATTLGTCPVIVSSGVLTSTSGAIGLAAAGSNKDVTLTASGTGAVRSASPIRFTKGDASTSTSTGTLVVTGGFAATGNITFSGASGASLRVASPVANGSVATAMSSVGPTGASTTIQGWLRISANGTDRYIPYW